MGEQPIDTALKALAAPERRNVLGELLSTESVTVPVSDDESIISLTHNHLPHLAGGHYVEYHRDDGGVTVERGSHFEQLRPLVEYVTEQEPELR